MNAVPTLRPRGIGSSKAAPAIGLSRWQNPFECWLELTGQTAPFEGNERTKWGLILEPVVRQEYAERTGRIVRLDPAATFWHPKHAFAYGHPDGITDDKRLYEGKTSRHSDEWGEPGSDQIPQEYMVQVQHMMACAGLEVCDVAVLIAGSDFRIYEIPADPQLQESIFTAEA